MIRHYVARRAHVIEDHAHNAAMRWPTEGGASQIIFSGCCRGGSSQAGRRSPGQHLSCSDAAATQAAIQRRCDPLRGSRKSLEAKSSLMTSRQIWPSGPLAGRLVLRQYNTWEWV